MRLNSSTQSHGDATHERPTLRAAGIVFSMAPIQWIGKGTLTVTGVTNLTVNHGALVVKAGSFGDSATQAFPKTAGIERILLLGFDGFITLEALRWINGIGAEMLYITPDGEVILHQAGRCNRSHPALQRKQAACHRADELIRYVLTAKLNGECELLKSFGMTEAGDMINPLAASLPNVTGVDALRLAEAQAAAVYWNALKDTPLRFPVRETAPDYWCTLGTRSSQLTGSPRRAVNPANAMLNYLFAIGETASVTALMAVGLNPQLGWLHNDQANRNSAALDLLECIRPDIERWAHNLWLVRTFSKAEFMEGADGCVRLMPSVTAELAATWPIWNKAVAPHAEKLAAILAGDNVKLPTPLTEGNRSNGRGKSYCNPKVPVAHAGIGLCRICGRGIPPDTVACDDCRVEYQIGVREKTKETLKAAWTERRDDDAAHTDAANDKRRQKIAANKEVQGGKLEPPSEAWTAEFNTLILPRLARIGIRRIARALDISQRYASLIKQGKVPSDRHRVALHGLVAGISLTLEM